MILDRATPHPTLHHQGSELRRNEVQQRREIPRRRSRLILADGLVVEDALMERREGYIAAQEFSHSRVNAKALG